jgi:acyl carrier protein
MIPLNQVSARSLIAEHLGVAAEEVQDEVTLRALGADSLDLVTLTMRLEEAFNFSLFDEDAEACVTVGDVFRMLQAVPNASSCLS